MDEFLFNVTELSRLFGVGPAYINRATKELQHETVEGRRGKFYRSRDVYKNLTRQAGSRGDASKIDLEIKEIERDTKRLKLEKMAGEVVSKADVEAVLAHLALTVVDLMDGIRDHVEDTVDVDPETLDQIDIAVDSMKKTFGDDVSKSLREL